MKIGPNIDTQKVNMPFAILIGVLVFVMLYHFAYLFPFTNNAFVVANVRPVAANVSGYITHLYVQNEQTIKKGDPLFTVFRAPYELAYQKASSDVKEAEAQLEVLIKRTEKTQHLVQAQQERYEKLRFDYQHNYSALREHAVSKLQVNTMLKDQNSALSQLKALQTESALNAQEVIVQKHKIQSLIAIQKNAKIDLDETTVYAKQNGSIQDMFSSLGTPIIIHKPIFSLIDTDKMYIQANFNETDLRRVQVGDKVSIFPRIYFGSKIYHGVVISRNWAASRLITHRSTQVQIVRNSESNWFLLPQRLPVQIRITDYDPVHYPLSIGASAYVYIHTW